MNWRSIRKKVLQIKLYAENNNEIVFALMLILVGFSAFGLGRLSVLESTREPARITQAAANGQREPLTIGGKVVASRNGTKYHAPWCGGAGRISEKNKIWFKSEEAARAAGYTPAGNCKGLR